MSKLIMTDNDARKFWADQGRTFWKDDKQFLKFNNDMLKNLFTFQEILELSTLRSTLSEDINWDEIEKEWKGYVSEWNEIRDIQSSQKALGFVGLTYLMVVFPYDKIKTGAFCNHELVIFNRAYFYNTSAYLPFECVEKLSNEGPMFPPAFAEWLFRLYDRASWWITYIVWERRNGLEHVIKK